MMSGYYGTPVFGRSHQFIPQGSVSAFVNKDTVATNTHAGGSLEIPEGELPLEEHADREVYAEKTDIQEFTAHDPVEETPEVSPVQSKFVKYCSHIV